MRRADGGGAAPGSGPAPGAPPPVRTVDVLVVGAGPAGLAAAARLAAAGAGRVVVLDREQRAGGIPRYCFHGGLGWPGSRRPGPEYASRAVEAALTAGAELRTGTTALGWAGPRTLHVTGGRGPERIAARAVVLATGARERPRNARLVPGTRPAGVLTTGELQQTVHLYGLPVGRRAVVVGAGPLGYAALDTLRGAGVRTVAMVTDQPCPEAPAARVRRARLVHGVPLLTRAGVTELRGRPRLTSVGLRHRDGRTTALDCDTVVFTGDRVPDNELARLGGLVLDPGTSGPAVDAAFRTGHEGVFAVGDALHAGGDARRAAVDGALAAGAVLRHLAAGGRPAAPGVPVRVASPLRWIAPNLVTPDVPPPHDHLLRFDRFVDHPTLLVTQDGRTLHRERHLRTAVPEGPVTLAGGWVARVDFDGGPVCVTAG